MGIPSKNGTTTTATAGRPTDRPTDGQISYRQPELGIFFQTRLLDYCSFLARTAFYSVSCVVRSVVQYWFEVCFAQRERGRSILHIDLMVQKPCSGALQREASNSF